METDRRARVRLRGTGESDTTMTLTSTEGSCRFVFIKADGTTMTSAENYIEPGYCIWLQVKQDTLFTGAR